MKKLAIVIAILATAITGAHAQTTRSGTFKSVTPAGTVKTFDTTVNTDTTYLWDGRSDHNQWGCSLQFINTQLSGTTTNTMIVQGSNDATSATTGTWYTLKNSYTTTTATTGVADTATTKNVNNIFSIPSCDYKYLRVRNITGGTQTSTLTGSWWLYTKYHSSVN